MSIKSRRGRPPKGDDKIANKTKQRNYRQRKKLKESVAAVMKRLRGSETATCPFRRLQMNILLLSAIEIENYLSELAGNHDAKGRLHGESSGGYDWNKIAQVMAAIQRDSNGRRVRPRGFGPA